MREQVKNRAFRYGFMSAVLLIFAWFTPAVQAVILVDNVSTVIDDGAPTTLTASHTTSAGADRLMIVGVSLNNDDFETVTSVTYDGTGLTFVGQIAISDDSRVELWSYLSPPVTTANVVVTFSNPVQRGAGAGVITFTGIDQVAPYGVFQSNTGTSSFASMIAISAPGETLLAVMAAEQQDSPPAVVGGTAQWSYKTQPALNNRTAGAGATYAGGPSVNVAWNLNESDQWAIGAISLRDATAAITVGFCDDFESGLGNWTLDTTGGGSAGINTDTASSPTNSLFTRWGVATVTNTDRVAAAGTPYSLRMWIRRGADSFSEDPDGGENLQVQYFNNADTWVTLETFSGSGTPGEIFARTYALPADAQHDNLRVRVRQTGGSGVDWDYWHVDDVCILEIVQPEIEFRMDELSWNGTASEVQDSSGNGNHANANAASGLTTVNPGHICRAGDFDGVDDYIESSDIFAILRDTASMSFWINTTQVGNDTGWMAPGVTGVEQAGGSDDIFWGWLDAAGRIGISVGNDFTTKSTVAVNDGTYHHVVLTRDAATGDWKIYIDGTLNASGTGTAGVIGTPFSSIGRIENTGGTPEYFQGDLDEMLVFNSVLSDGAVTSIYTNQAAGLNLDGSQRICQGSLAYFQLDEASGTWNGTPGEIADQSVNFNGAFALGTGAGVDAVPARVCNGIDIPFNNTNGQQYGFDSTVDIDDDVGNLGTISFWYNSDNAWVGGGSRMLMDASPDDLEPQDKYFYLELQNNGRLEFALEDDSDGDFRFTTGVFTFAANTWVHLAVTWDMGGAREIYVNGTLAASNSSGTTGQIGELRTLYFGDNRSTYHFGGTGNSANGIIDEARIYARVQTGAEITTDMNATHPCPSTLAGFDISPATTMASTCLPNAITITALDSFGNTITDYTGTVTISTTGHGNWSVNTAANSTTPPVDNNDDGMVGYTFLLADVGDIILDLTNTHAESLTITVADSVAGVSTTNLVDVITFADNVFVITEDPVQVAGRPMAMNIAMWTNDGVNCFIDTNYDYDPQTLDISIDRGGVLLGANPPSIGGVNIPDTPGTAAVDLDFSVTPGQAGFNLDSNDVGQYTISLTDNTAVHAPGNVITGTSAVLTVRPFGIAVTNISAPAGPTPNPRSTLPAQPIFTVAGLDFEADVAGVLWDAADDTDNDGVLDTGTYANNTAAPSYAWDTTLSVSAAGFTPVAGAPGVLNNGTILLGEFSGGSFTVTDLQYTEVGSFTLQSEALDFLDEPSADIVGEDIIVGRFIPTRFIVNINTDGVLDEACVGHTYLGQSFSYVGGSEPTITVTAENALMAPTRQYRDGFVKLGATSVSVVATRDDTTPGSDATPLLISYGLAAMTDSPNNDGTVDYTFGADSFRYGPAAPASFAKYDNSEVDEFTADINPEITQVGDGEVTTSYAAGTHLLDPVGNLNRFGRLRMKNTFGSELGPLLMPVYVEYLDDGVYQRSVGDTCTTITDLDLLNVPPAFSVPTVVNSPALAGEVNYDYPAPGATGSVDTTTRLDPANADHLWLRYDWDGDGVFDNDPTARADFGIFDGNQFQIYQQQIFQ